MPPNNVDDVYIELIWYQLNVFKDTQAPQQKHDGFRVKRGMTKGAGRSRLSPQKKLREQPPGPPFLIVHLHLKRNAQKADVVRLKIGTMRTGGQ